MKEIKNFNQTLTKSFSFSYILLIWLINIVWLTPGTSAVIYLGRWLRPSGQQTSTALQMADCPSTYLLSIQWTHISPWGTTEVRLRVKLCTLTYTRCVLLFGFHHVTTKNHLVCFLSTERKKIFPAEEFLQDFYFNHNKIKCFFAIYYE